VKALVDSGSQVSLLSHEIYDELTLSGYSTLEIPLQSTVLITTFHNKSRRIRLKALLDFSISGDTYEQIFLIGPKLLAPVILGAEFLNDNRVSIDFEDEFIKTEKNRAICRYKFENNSGKDGDRRWNQGSDRNIENEETYFNNIPSPITDQTNGVQSNSFVVNGGGELSQNETIAEII
jgi:hypothetical protein